MKETLHILLVDDDAVDRMSVKRMLDRSGLKACVQECDSMASGIKAIHAQPYDCVLIDYRLPDGDGMEFFSLLKQQKLTEYPIILLTGINDESIGDQAITAGMQDYLVKDWVNEGTLRRSIRYAIERKNIQREMQRINDELEQRVAQRTAALKNSNYKLLRTNEQLRVAQMGLIEAAKTESITSLAAGVAHEVKNPLQIILMGLDYLKSELNDAKPTVQTVLEDIRTASYRADAIVKDLLEFSRVSKLELKPVQLNEVINKSLSLVKLALMKKQITVKKKLCGDLPQLHLDVGKMEQVFINLIMNSLHAMKSKGTITISTTIEPMDYALACVGGSALIETTSDKMVVVAQLEDDGPGIPPEVMPRIFEAFFSTKQVGEGTGLGLALLRTIVQLHSGNIFLRNRQSGGVRATLVLPIQPKAASSTKAPSQKTA